MYLDSLAMLVIVAGLMVSCAACVFTTGYLKRDVRGPRVFALIALGDATLVGLATSYSIPQWAAWSILAGVGAYLLAIPVPLGPGGLGIFPVPRGLTTADLTVRANSALALLCVRLAGDALILLGCGLLAGKVAGLSFVGLWTNFGGTGEARSAVWLLLAGAVCHAGAFPVSVLVPEVKGLPTPAAALVLASTVLPSGVLLLVRLFPVLGETELLVLSVLGALTILVSAVAAVAEGDLRRLVAWMTVGSCGAMLASVGAGSPGGAALQLSATLFGGCILLLATGSVLHNCLGERRLSRYGGLLFRMPASSLLLAHGAGTLLGGPLLAGSGAWNTMLSHGYRSVQSGEVRGWVTSVGLWAGMPLLALAAGRAWSLVFLGRRRDRAVWGSARESATLSVPVAILAVVATVSGHPVLSPVRQLVLAWPAETRSAVEAVVRASGGDELSVDDWDGLALARDVAPPVVRPPPAPEDVQPADEVETMVPPDDKTPRLIDPLRWSLAGALAVVGLAWPGLFRHVGRRVERGRRAISGGGYLARAGTGVVRRAGRAGAEVLVGMEALLVTPVWERWSSVMVPWARSVQRERVGEARTQAEVGERRRLVSVVLFAGVVALLVVGWAVTWMGLVRVTELQSVLEATRRWGWPR
jgi:NADH:ubiquinone oxidoreductase subunit 5 (subunit L)/multisubunit Na+/H+ antiporter MnhA subunit